jgi:hypothetical protein
MTDDMMNLRALVEKTPDADLLREMIGFAAHRLMALEVEGLTGAAYGEKSSERLSVVALILSPNRQIVRASPRAAHWPKSSRGVYAVGEPGEVGNFFFSPILAEA